MVNSSFTNICKCRLCSSNKLSPFFNFGFVPLGNNLHDSEEKAISSELFPLAIQRCKDCSHFQLSVSVAPSILYATNYTYLSSIGKSFLSHLKSYADWCVKDFSLNSSSLVLDIGSNDGSCLSFFKSNSCKVLGIDPAQQPAKIANQNGIPTINKFFDETVVDSILDKYGQADFITSHNALAHIDNLESTFINIHRLLKPRSYFIFEIGYFKSVLQNDLFDTTYHEHLDYHHANPLARLLIKLGFEIINLSTNQIQGGSLRVHVRKSDNPIISKEALAFLENESQSVLYQDAFLKNWRENISLKMHSFQEKIIKYVSKGHLVAGYGVPTKSTLLLSLSSLSSKEISFMVEDNSLKIGKYLPSTGIPIFSIDKLKTIKPNIIIIFAWNFADEIISKLRTYVDWELKCIIPLPEYIEVEL